MRGRADVGPPRVLFVCAHDVGRAQMAADIVIAMGCGVACPIAPGNKYLDWDLEDPAGTVVESVGRVRDEIKTASKP
ncbi:hypothetical protein ACJWDR_01485 [Streptomyces tauricus]|uniref:hypothetical protein n=1 Tax=Streptomyces tauricus TaxID=68274 RepID=UPI00387F29E6